jgi:uncharacterized protein GlcG (DUF336 family)
MINLKDARQVIAAAEAKAHELGQPMNIAVVDGAIGVSGGSGSQDQAVATSGAAAIQG